MHSSLIKTKRHKLLLETIRSTSVTRQDRLVDLLRNNGFSVTQASVSRDLDELGITKQNGVYRQIPSARSTEFGELEFRPVGDNLVVAKCASGLASALAVKLDAANLDGVVGTLAGDDTVFIAVVGKSEQEDVIFQLKEIFR